MNPYSGTHFRDSRNPYPHQVQNGWVSHHGRPKLHHAYSLPLGGEGEMTSFPLGRDKSAYPPKHDPRNITYIDVDSRGGSDFYAHVLDKSLFTPSTPDPRPPSIAYSGGNVNTLSQNGYGAKGQSIYGHTAANGHFGYRGTKGHSFHGQTSQMGNFFSRRSQNDPIVSYRQHDNNHVSYTRQESRHKAREQPLSGTVNGDHRLLPGKMEDRANQQPIRRNRRSERSTVTTSEGKTTKTETLQFKEDKKRKNSKKK